MAKLAKRYLLDGVKTPRSKVVEKIGEERLKVMERDAEVQFRSDPLVQNDFFCGPFMLTIEFPCLDIV